MLDKQPITGIQGSTFNINLFAKNDDGTSFDLNGYSISGYAKTNYASTGKLLNFTISTVGSPSSGYINLSGSANNLAVTPIGVYPYNIEAQTGDYIIKLFRDFLYVYPESANL